jgi:hypothetical protein
MIDIRRDTRPGQTLVDSTATQVWPREIEVTDAAQTQL